MFITGPYFAKDLTGLWGSLPSTPYTCVVILGNCCFIALISYALGIYLCIRGFSGKAFVKENEQGAEGCWKNPHAVVRV